MQTTLLGLAIAFILALIAALIGPLFIDWNQYKPQFEAEAARVIGAPVRVEGALDARLLPAPILRLRKLSIGKSSDASKVSADKLDVEFSLGSLLRGEWRATELSLDGFDLDIGFGKDGRIDWPASKGGFNLGALAIDRLNVNGQVDLHDAASGTQLSLTDFSFKGDVRALATSLRGEGAFVLAGARTPFRVSTSQTPDNRGVRARLMLDAGERPLSADLDGVVTFTDQSPRIDGALTLARIASSPQMPWRISSKIKAAPASASFDEMEWIYGADDVALKLNGSGEMQFGATPKVQIKMSGQQLDADRLLSKSGRTVPIDIIGSLRDVIAAAPALPVPAQFNIDADQITLGGRPVQNLSVALRGDATSWTLGGLDMTAPGLTRVTVSGAFKPGDDARFEGPMKIDSMASQSFQDWLLGQPATGYRAETPLTITATAAVARDRTELSGLKMNVAGGSLEGRVARSGDLLEAVLKSSAFDLGNPAAAFDRFSRLKAAMPPRAKLSLDISRAILGGQNSGALAFDLDYRGDAQPSGTMLDVTVRRADLAPWLGIALPVSGLKANLSISGDKYAFTAIDGKIGNTQAKGSVALTSGDDISIDGELAFDTLDIAPLTAAALGGSSGVESAPLTAGWLQGWRGRIGFNAGHAALPGETLLNDFRGVLRRDDTSLYVDDLKANIGSGEASAKLQAARGASTTSVSAQIQVANADGDALKYRALALPEGKASAQLTLSSEGRSLAALANAMSSNGVLTLEGAHIKGLDVDVFDAAQRANDAGQAMNDAKLKALVDPILSRGALAVSAAQIPFDMRDGRLRVAATTLDAGGARAVVSGGYDMPADQLDIRAVLSSLQLGTQTSRPELQLFFHGTPDVLDRSIDVSALSSWLALQSIERETKRLDQLEKGLPAQPATPPHSEQVPSAAPQAAPGAAPKSAPKPAPNSAPKAAAAPSPVPRVAEEERPLAPLPPPIIIRPAPGVRPKKPAPRDLPPVGSAF